MRVAAISDIHGNLPALVESIRAGTAPVGEQLLKLLVKPPTPDEATAHHETLRGA